MAGRSRNLINCSAHTGSNLFTALRAARFADNLFVAPGVSYGIINLFIFAKRAFIPVEVAVVSKIGAVAVLRSTVNEGLFRVYSFTAFAGLIINSTASAVSISEKILGVYYILVNVCNILA